MKKHIRMMIIMIGIFCFLTGCDTEKDSYAERLYQAITQEDYETFKALLKEDGDINTIRDAASKKGIFRNAKNAMDFENVYPLEIACQKSPAMAYDLLEAGADVQVVDPYLHSTPLLYALSSDQPKRFELAMELIHRGADVGHMDDNRRVALNLAVHILETDPEETKEQSFELVKLLLEQTDLEKVIQSSASNPLREAAKYNNCTVIRYILEQGLIEIDLKTDGMTPLMIAVINKNVDASRVLLENKADVEAISDEGKTAYDYAKENEDKELQKLLEKDGTDVYNADALEEDTSPDVDAGFFDDRTGDVDQKREFVALEEDELQRVLETLGTDYGKVKWVSQYRPEGMEGLLISVAPYYEGADIYLLTALTNLYEKDITVLAEGYAVGNHHENIGDFVICDTAIRSGSTTITSIPCDGDPTGTLHWNEISVSEEEYDESTYWESDWQLERNDEGDEALKYSLTLKERGQAGTIHALVLDKDGCVLAYNSDYNMDEGIIINGFIPLYAERIMAEKVDVAVFANPLKVRE